MKCVFASGVFGSVYTLNWVVVYEMCLCLRRVWGVYSWNWVVVLIIIIMIIIVSYHNNTIPIIIIMAIILMILGLYSGDYYNNNGHHNDNNDSRCFVNSIVSLGTGEASYLK